jgi:mRNA interferase YafQ
MLNFAYSPKFKKDLKHVARKGWDIGKMFHPVAILFSGQPLPPSFEDHLLEGEWAGYKDFHIEPDWIVIYRIVDGVIILERTGTHDDLFKK